MTTTLIDSASPTGPVSIMRVKLGPARPVDSEDPLGRVEVGYRDGLSPQDLWDRGRGVWKAKATKILEAALLVIVYRGEVKLVGTVEGLTKHGDRLAVIGRPLPDHALIGQPDPVENWSSNPVAYQRFDSLFPSPSARSQQPDYSGFHRS